MKKYTQVLVLDVAQGSGYTAVVCTAFVKPSAEPMLVRVLPG